MGDGASNNAGISRTRLRETAPRLFQFDGFG